ncbi:hypothetical protein CES86_3706 [Brucella lupini]|uniref:Uncharacterized protein n=1 Tax=Brucella lupini TaxID=255457 RepID=A0A256GGW1_9HYPH|nr:hypothetical protein CES86_3706 [Brucella lupini]
MGTTGIQNWRSKKNQIGTKMRGITVLGPEWVQKDGRTLDAVLLIGSLTILSEATKRPA